MAGQLDFATGIVNGNQVTLLRDTGCSSIAVHRNLVTDDQILPDRALCILIDGTAKRFPTAQIQIESPYFNGVI